MDNILFKIQGAGHYGLGHLNRSLNIAKFFKAGLTGINCFFLINNNEFIAKKIKSENFHFEYDCHDLISVIKKFKITKVIFDQYDEIEADVSYVKNIDPKITACALDYFKTDNKHIDLVINLVNRHKFEIAFSGHTEYHEGFQFVTLNHNFLKFRLKNISNSSLKNRILVTFGGSDPQNFTEFVINLISTSNLDLSRYHLTIVITSIMNSEDKLKSLISKINCRCSIIKDAKNMAEIINESMIGICSGGTTMYEFSMLGVPAIVLPQNENEILGALKFSLFGSIKVIERQNTSFSKEIIHNIQLLLSDKHLWSCLSKAGREAIDGLGALRICNILQGASKK
ncbi:glycosyltransferase [Polynucleobacter sp. AP-Sanab-80-C2]|uniref:glycosyltransferase n=1 Tax=Polynucleobacter sp. AP-Sanab-80-C2 TaxID=3108274 RepID=UPI002B237088|nr:glycosyltransferase [Polynucleobacter sp. AP-Sanab-80-C2]MEA9598561.1 glycosyltransferase [Polynucleobacter sp. AP-Sanab-80-C2]